MAYLKFQLLIKALPILMGMQKKTSEYEPCKQICQPNTTKRLLKIELAKRKKDHYLYQISEDIKKDF